MHRFFFHLGRAAASCKRQSILLSLLVMKLPNGERADLGTKLEDYTLNPVHRDGRHKARVFESLLGITAANANLLRNALLEAASTSEVAVAKGETGYGE